MESFEQSIQQNLSGIPQEFLKLYEFGKLLGVGTTSKVYQIFHKRRKYVGHRKPFACKIIDKRKLTMGMLEEDVEPLLQQLRKEVDILRRIDHPHIVAFQDFVETKRLLFIITEYLPGGELFDYILKYGPLPEDLACKSLYGIFSAIAYMHDRGVIHRDIKAENVIFFHKVNGEVSLKLIDFGFSTILKHDLTGSFLGTGGYIAPEIRQNKQYSMSVDNWALGVLLYCTMSAKLPFSISLDALPSDLLECSEHFKLRFPSKQWIGVSESCKDLIRQLLTIDPFVRLAAKDALLHPWFRPARMQKRLSNKSKSTAGSTVSTPRSLEEDNETILHMHAHPPPTATNRYYEVDPATSDEEEDGQTESEGSENGSGGHEYNDHARRDDPLRKLYNSDLRPVQSMIQLERKHNRFRPDLVSPTAVSQVPRCDASQAHVHHEVHLPSHPSRVIATEDTVPDKIETNISSKSSNSQKGPTLWEVPPPITTNSVFFTESLKDWTTPKSDYSASSKTPRDIIHSKPVQDQTKLPSIRIATSYQRQHNLHSYNSPNRILGTSSRDFGGIEEDISCRSADMTRGLEENGLVGHFTVSSHDITSMPPTLLAQSIQRESSFVQEEIHDKLAGVLFYYTYIPLNSAMH
jgi:serine/threonine protein kinase